MDLKEQDSNTLIRIFHPLQFAVVMILIVLIITFTIRRCTKAPEELTEEKISPTAQITKYTAPIEKGVWKKISVQSGDTLASILKRANVKQTDYLNLIQIDQAKKYLKALKPKQTFHLLINDKNQLETLIYNIDRLQDLEITKENEIFVVKLVKRTLEKRLKTVNGVIQHSFSLAANKSGLPNQLILSLANIFAWDIDFKRQIRPGDTFKVLYEQFYLDGKELEPGKIIAAEINNDNTQYNAIYYKNNNGSSDYYTPAGKNLRRAFLRSPIKYKRISSHFNSKRKHPIFHTIRPHGGVDLAAPTGTPIKASADGRITFRGRKARYGKTIIIKHNQKYTTLYAHLSQFSTRLRSGSYVKQGQLIGHVGQTGLATGAHLHYELRINNIKHDPMKTKLPAANPIPQKELTAFQDQAKIALNKLKQA